MAVPGEHAHAIIVTPANEPETVVLDFIGPVGSGRHGVAVGRQARFDKSGQMTNGSGSVAAHEPIHIPPQAPNANPLDGALIFLGVDGGLSPTGLNCASEVHSRDHTCDLRCPALAKTGRGIAHAGR